MVDKSLKEWMYQVTSSGGTDFVVEQGTDDIWTWRKWNSGIAECWGYTTAMTTNCNTTYGYQYYGAMVTRAFPAGLFAQRPTLSASCDGGDGLWIGTSTIQSNQFTYYPYCGKNGSHTYALSMHAVGRWK